MRTENAKDVMVLRDLYSELYHGGDLLAVNSDRYLTAIILDRLEQGYLGGYRHDIDRALTLMARSESKLKSNDH